ncbi:MAG: hypothetical protein AAGM36_15130, partial [Cyanobacteria bacterium J06597_1]
MFSDPRADAVIPPIIFGVLNLVYGIKLCRQSLSQTGGRVPLRRLPGQQMGTRLLLGQFYILIILMLGFLAQDLTLPSMGISESIHFIPALAIGVLAGIVFIYGTNWFIERIGMGDSLSD